MHPAHYAYLPAPVPMPPPDVAPEPLPEPPRVIEIETWTHIDTSVEDDVPAPSRSAARHPHTLKV